MTEMHAASVDCFLNCLHAHICSPNENAAWLSCLAVVLSGSKPESSSSCSKLESSSFCSKLEPSAFCSQGSNGQLQLHEDSEGVTQLSIQTLYYMLREPAAAADIIKADLAGLVVQIMQGPSLKSVTGFSAIVLNSLHGFSCQPQGRQQLLDRLTPDSVRVMIELSLDALEAPTPSHAALVFAAGGALVNRFPHIKDTCSVPSYAQKGNRLLCSFDPYCIVIHILQLVKLRPRHCMPAVLTSALVTPESTPSDQNGLHPVFLHSTELLAACCLESLTVATKLQL